MRAQGSGPRAQQRGSFRYPVILLVATSLLGCNANPRLEIPPLLLHFPRASELLAEGDKLTSIDIEVECAALVGLHHLPDGWSYRVEVDGEDYQASIRPRNPSTVAPFDVPPIIEISLRGQWSDCYNARLTVHYERAGSTGLREFRTDGLGVRFLSHEHG